jgi:hypothetical protein
MSLNVLRERQQAHAYLDRLPPDQLSVLANASAEDEEISEEEEQSVPRSKEWFKNNQGSWLNDVAAELGYAIKMRRVGEESQTR